MSSMINFELVNFKNGFRLCFWRHKVRQSTRMPLFHRACAPALIYVDEEAYIRSPMAALQVVYVYTSVYFFTN